MTRNGSSKMQGKVEQSTVRERANVANSSLSQNLMSASDDLDETLQRGSSEDVSQPLVSNSTRFSHGSQVLKTRRCFMSTTELSVSLELTNGSWRQIHTGHGCRLLSRRAIGVYFGVKESQGLEKQSLRGSILSSLQTCNINLSI